MATAGGGEHAADPGPQTEADHRERAAPIGLKAVIKHLFETTGNRIFVANAARPKPRLASRTRRDGDEIAVFQPAAATQFRQRIAAQVIRFVGEWQSLEFGDGAHHGRIDALRVQKGGVRRHRGDHLVKQCQDSLLRRAPPVPTQDLVQGKRKKLVLRGQQPLALRLSERSIHDAVLVSNNVAQFFRRSIEKTGESPKSSARSSHPTACSVRLSAGGPPSRTGSIARLPSRHAYGNGRLVILTR